MPHSKDGGASWMHETLIRMGVFATTGMSSMYLVRPATEKCLGIQGTLRDGPWSYRLACLGIFTPCYACILVAVGTLVGQQAYFLRIAYRTLNRFNPYSSENLVARARAYLGRRP